MIGPCIQPPAGLVQSIGFAAAILTTVSFAPQVVRTWRSGGRDLSPAMLWLFGVGVGLWLAYGILTDARPVIAANALTTAQILAIAVLRRRGPQIAVSRTSEHAAIDADAPSLSGRLPEAGIDRFLSPRSRQLR